MSGMTPGPGVRLERAADLAERGRAEREAGRRERVGRQHRRRGVAAGGGRAQAVEQARRIGEVGVDERVDELHVAAGHVEQARGRRVEGQSPIAGTSTAHAAWPSLHGVRPTGRLKPLSWRSPARLGDDGVLGLAVGPLGHEDLAGAASPLSRAARMIALPTAP